MPLNEDTILTMYLAFWLTVLGAALGSFLDCAVSRWAAGERMFAGRFSLRRMWTYFVDFGPDSRIQLAFSPGEVPVLRRKIPADCLAAELAGALGFLILGLTVPLPALGQWIIWWALLLALSLADWARRIIPNPLLLALLVNRIVWFFVRKEKFQEFLNIFMSCLVPAALLALVLLAERFLGREVMGGGDIKLLFVLSFYLDWANMLLLLLVSCIFGILWSVPAGLETGDSGALRSLPGGGRSRDSLF